MGVFCVSAEADSRNLTKQNEQEQRIVVATRLQVAASFSLRNVRWHSNCRRAARRCDNRRLGGAVIVAFAMAHRGVETHLKNAV